MATKSTTKGKSSRKKQSTSKRGRPTKKEQKRNRVNRLWSIVFFAVGIVITAMAFVPGEQFWSFLRQNVLFGVFGFSGYFLGPVILYIGGLTLGQKPIELKMVWAMCFIILLSNFIQVFFGGEIAGQNLWRIITELHALGKAKPFSGGRLGVILAVPMIKYFGRISAKICIFVLTITFFMLLTDTTPHDIYIKTKEKRKRAEEELAKQNRLRKKAKEERRRERRKLARQQQEEREILEKTKPTFRRKIDFDIDDTPSRDVFADDETEAAPIVPASKAKKRPDIEFESDTRRIVAKTVDTVKDEQQAERQKIEDVMRRLNMTKQGATPQPEEAETVAAAEKPQPEEDKPGYRYPPIDLFQKSVKTGYGDSDSELVANAKKLVDTLKSFGVQTEIIDFSKGPAVTRYELRPLAGVKVSRITNLADDIALNLATSGVRIEAPIPGKAAVGIEVPNKKSSSVNIRTIFESGEFKNSQSPLAIALGEDISGKPVVADLTKMPHLLIAGATGSGKSVCVNSIITSFIYKSSPEDVKLILIDPKVVELSEYNGIPNLYAPVVTDAKKATGALGGAVAEMEKRYRLFAENSVRDIKSYNRLVRQKQAEKQAAQTRDRAEVADAGQPRTPELEKMPYIVIVIDELADLMMVSGKEVEDYICRLAQKARAAGMHLIVATQRPSVDVITGLIKANIPSRIAFAVSSGVDSRTILDSVGAEKLLGMGDMLFMPVGRSKPTRVQGTFVRDEEITAVIDFLKNNSSADYNEEFMDATEKYAPKGKNRQADGDDGDDDTDEMLPKAIEVVIDAGQASTSLLQRKLKLGYARAARIMDQMEEKGIVGPYEGSKPRQVLITKTQWQEMVLRRSE